MMISERPEECLPYQPRFVPRRDTRSLSENQPAWKAGTLPLSYSRKAISILARNSTFVKKRSL